jgi:hypothetical protein
MHTTAMGVLEEHICLPPLDLVVQGEARSAARRLWSLEYWSYLHPSRGHSYILLQLRKSYSVFNVGSMLWGQYLALNPSVGLLC